MTTTAVEAAAARPAGLGRAMVERILAYAILAAGAVWLLANFVEAPGLFFESLLAGLKNGTLYALIALGYTLVYGIIELINFAHGDLFMLGTVFSGFFMVGWLGQGDPGVAAFGALLLTVILAMIFCALINVAAERVAYRRLRRAPKLAALITAVGLSFIYQWVGLQWNGSRPRQWDRAVRGVAFEIAGVSVGWATLIVVAVTIPVLVFLTYVVQRTKQGKAMRATAQDQDAARLMGIDVDRTIAFTFALGGAMAGAAGALYIQAIGTTRYDAGFQLGLIAFTAAVLGGIGNLTGAVLGGVLIGLIQACNDGLPYGFGQKWSQTVVFTILILLMVFKPEGILGKPTTEKV
ncbi:MAG: branched-chain amino acid ABC transporter permease [Actinomycetota bacterium]|nr:branched-chain amino acid ABC transporter permease [Actinomycetota bacterium]